MGCFHRDDAQLGLADIGNRLAGTDLIPSFEPLRDAFPTIAPALSEAGVHTVGALRHHLKTPRRRAVLADRAGLDPDLLVLLRRYVEGWFPKPPLLAAFEAEQSTVAALAGLGIRTAADLLAATSTGGEHVALAERAGSCVHSLQRLRELSDLTRIQWVAPAFAEIIHAAGFTSPQELAATKDIDDLHRRLTSAQAAAQPGRPQIGRRDVERLVELAAWLPSLSVVGRGGAAV